MDLGAARTFGLLDFLSSSCLLSVSFPLLVVLVVSSVCEFRPPVKPESGWTLHAQAEEACSGLVCLSFFCVRLFGLLLSVSLSPLLPLPPRSLARLGINNTDLWLA